MSEVKQNNTDVKEIWKPIKGYEESYDVSNHGRVRSWIKSSNQFGITKRKIPKIKKSFDNHSGYQQLMLYKDSVGKNHLVHRLVAEVFLPNPKDKPEVNHIDGDHKNNHINNLEWVTPKENGEHASETGLVVRGEDHGRCKLTEDEVLEIRNVYMIGCFSQYEIADAYGVCRKQIGNIVNRKKWTHI